MVPSCWLIPEWMRSYQGLGGPWDLYGASQWQHPAVLALAAVGGVWLISVALLIANAAIAVLLGAIRPSLFLPPPSPPPRRALANRAPLRKPRVLRPPARSSMTRQPSLTVRPLTELPARRARSPRQA